MFHLSTPKALCIHNTSNRKRIQTCLFNQNIFQHLGVIIPPYPQISNRDCQICIQSCKFYSQSAKKPHVMWRCVAALATSSRHKNFPPIIPPHGIHSHFKPFSSSIS